MRFVKQIIVASVLLIAAGCVTTFFPDTDETQELLVVEGVVTNQTGVNTIKLSKSQAIGTVSTVNPLKGCIVSISDDLGSTYQLTEISPGNYVTNPLSFQGEIGRTYTLHIKEKINTSLYKSYQSLPMEMKPVPPIDNVYYEKVVLHEKDDEGPLQEGCQIYLDTYDPDNLCRYYRWDYAETWEFWLPYEVDNQVCWISENSDVINIKNTSILSQNNILRYPLNLITNETDKLSVKYSIMVNQYSLNESEYNYWWKLQNITEDVGSLYDVIPSSVIGNVFCVDNQVEPVLGYFSVSAKTSKRIFVRDAFKGLPSLYRTCPSDTVAPGTTIAGLNSTVWIIIAKTIGTPPYYLVLTDRKGCADCTVRGTAMKPEYWDEE